MAGQIAGLVKERMSCKELIHRLVKRDSRYVSLINPVSTCTLGHCTTIESIAFTVGDDMETLLTYLKGEMEREDIQFKY